MSTASVFPGPDPSAPGAELGRAVTGLRDAAEVARSVLTPEAFATVRDSTAAAVALDLAAVAELASAGAAVALGRVADSGYPQAEGFVTAGTWWRAATRVSGDRAGEQVRLARRLRKHYAATQEAWAGGSITGGHAELIATGVDSVLARLARRARREARAAGVDLDAGELAATLAEARATLESELLGLARQWGPETIRVALARARLAADPDGASEEAMAAELKASLTLEEVGDLAVLTAQVSKELAAKLRTVLDHYRDRLFHTGTGDGTGETGTGAAGDGAGGGEVDPVTGDPVRVSNAQRDAAALSAWVDETLGGGLGNNPVSERPHLDIVVSLSDLADGTGAAVLERTGTPVPVATAARCACDGDVRVVLVDGQYRDPHSGEVIDPVRMTTPFGPTVRA